MCVNFRTTSRAEIEAIIADDIQGDVFETPRDVWSLYDGIPIVRRDPSSNKRVVESAMFGLIPPWTDDRKYGRRTYNARSETVGEKPSFKAAWRARQFCLVPMTRYYEPNYEAGKPVRWAIGRSDQPTFAAAAIYSLKKYRGAATGDLSPAETHDRDVGYSVSFALLTLNCDDHPVLRRFHAPDDEKRSIVHVRPEEYDAWLDATCELARVMLDLPPADLLDISPAPLPPRGKAKSAVEG